jgi:hypothetical protein
MQARGNIVQLLGDRVLAPKYRDVVMGDFAIMSQGISYDGGLEIAVTAQAIAAAPVTYGKTIVAHVSVAGFVTTSLCFLKTLTAYVKVGGSITRSVTRTLRAFVSALGTVNIPLIDIGSEAIDRSNNSGDDLTIIDVTNPADGTGTLSVVEVWCQADATGVKVATFSKSGTTFTARAAATIGDVTAGSKQTFTVSIAVVVGDYIGMFMETGRVDISLTGGSGVWYAAGDKTGTSATYTEYAGRALSLYGKGAGG